SETCFGYEVATESRIGTSCPQKGHWKSGNSTTVIGALSVPIRCPAANKRSQIAGLISGHAPIRFRNSRRTTTAVRANSHIRAIPLASRESRFLIGIPFRKEFVQHLDCRPTLSHALDEGSGLLQTRRASELQGSFGTWSSEGKPANCRNVGTMKHV